MTAPRWSRRRLLVEIRRMRGVLSRADIRFAKSRGWNSAEVDRTRLQLRALELMVVGESLTRSRPARTKRSASAVKASA